MIYNNSYFINVIRFDISCIKIHNKHVKSCYHACRQINKKYYLLKLFMAIFVHNFFRKASANSHCYIEILMRCRK